MNVNLCGPYFTDFYAYQINTQTTIHEINSFR